MPFEKTKELTLGEIDNKTKRRLLEVKFYVMYKEVFDYVAKENAHHGAEFLEALAVVAGVSPIVMRRAYNYMRNDYYKPTKREISLMGVYEGLSYREISLIFGNAGQTIATHIRQFIEAGRSPLPPKFVTPEEVADIEKALSVITIFLGPIGERHYLLNKARKKKERNKNKEEVS
jgi:hypothetical protein